MRIISGKHKGFRFPEKKMPHARPTTDRAKESLFSILNGRIDFEDLSVLDLYAGLGSVAFEFVSRGAEEVVAVDSSIKSVKYIQDIQSKLKSDVKIVQEKVLSFLKRNSNKFDLTFADPPYAAAQEIADLIQFFENEPDKRPSNALIIEHSTALQMDNPNITESRNYGQSTFSFFTFE
jgi:16S rRNA (guanine(966)-N(2))-methyltransferase RsmD